MQTQCGVDKEALKARLKAQRLSAEARTTDGHNRESCKARFQGPDSFQSFGQSYPSATIRDNTRDDWAAGAIRFVETKFQDMELLTGEDIRFALGAANYPEPAHHNSWGALIGQMTKGSYPLLVDSGERRPMKGKKSNGRQTPIYFFQSPKG